MSDEPIDRIRAEVTRAATEAMARALPDVVARMEAVRAARKAAEDRRSAQAIAKGIAVLDRIMPNWREGPVRTTGSHSPMIRGRLAVGIPSPGVMAAARASGVVIIDDPAGPAWVQAQIDKHNHYYETKIKPALESGAFGLNKVNALRVRRRVLTAKARRLGIRIPSFADDEMAVAWLEARLNPEPQVA